VTYNIQALFSGSGVFHLKVLQVKVLLHGSNIWCPLVRLDPREEFFSRLLPCTLEVSLHSIVSIHTSH
jgi:hypothetical protein